MRVDNFIMLFLEIRETIPVELFWLVLQVHTHLEVKNCPVSLLAYTKKYQYKRAVYRTYLLES